MAWKSYAHPTLDAIAHAKNSSRGLESCRATTKKAEPATKPATLRERLRKSTELPTPLLSPELIEKLTTLPGKLGEVGNDVVQKLDGTAQRSALRLTEI